MSGATSRSSDGRNAAVRLRAVCAVGTQHRAQVPIPAQGRPLVGREPRR
ncbi:hypothetical protein ACFPM0_16820 [Pseudonocardia sulfidoxydans]